VVTKIVPEGATLIPDSAECVFKGIIYDVYHWPQQLFDGTAETFEMLRRADTVTAACVTDGKFIVLRDKQPHRGMRTTFPGGRVEPGETTLAAIKREVHEETGYSFKNWRLVQAFQPHSKIEHFVYLYLAWEGGRTSAPHTDPGEEIELDLVSFEETKRLVESGTGYMGESRELFSDANGVADLLRCAEFAGEAIRRL
jgi:ADP-ribose pyrophosphatase